VTIGMVNVAPVARADAATTDTDTAVTVPATGNDTDPNGDPITVSGTTAAAHGTVADNGDGTLTYTPATGFFGLDTFAYTIADPDGLSSAAIVTITVRNAPPVATDDHFLIRPGIVTPLAVLTNDHDLNIGQPLSVLSIGPAGHGQTGLAASGTVTYQSAPGATGTDTFTYVLSDGLGGTDTGTVTVTLDAAPLPGDDTVSTASGTAVDIPVTANDIDPESEVITVTAVGTPMHGSATLNPGGTVRYTPAAGFTGTDTFSYAVRDTVGNTATGRVTVLVGNAPPVAWPDEAAVLEDRHVDVDVLANDTDVNSGQTLSIAGIDPPAHGTAILAGVRIRYTPSPGWIGRDSFRYRVTDGAGGVAEAIVTVTVTPGTPAAVPDERTTPYQHAITVPVLANDLDPAGTLAVVAVTQPADGTATYTAGSVGYVPPTGFSGVALFQYTAMDDAGHRVSAMVMITVGAAPAVPDKTVTAKPGAPVAVPLPAVDLGGRPVTVVSVGKPAHGTARLNADGTVTYIPASGFTGTDSFTYEVIDADGNVAQAMITVTVARPDRAPVAADDTVTTAAGHSVLIRPVANDHDPDGDPIAINKIGNPGHGTAKPNVDGTVTYEPSRGFGRALDSFPYTISDGHGRFAMATVTVRVAAAAALPITGRDVIAVLGTGTLTVLAGALLYWTGTSSPADVPIALPGGREPGTPSRRSGRHRR
jgi:hypothetical protein